MRTRLWLFLVLLILAALAACQTQQPPAVEATSTVEEQPAPSSEESPSPSGEEYPAPNMPTQVPFPGSASVLYPGPQSGDTVSWIQAESMILNGEVTSVVQTHSAQVTLTLKDGRTLITQEPNLDDVFKVIEICGDLCGNIQIATE